MPEHNINHHQGQDLRHVIAIVGPTASGKSEWGLKIAQHIEGAILSCDSRQIFKDAPIGTCQVQGSRTQRFGFNAIMVKTVPHYFVGFLNPTEPYSVAMFQTQALQLLELETRCPVLVGGTGFYLSSIIDHWDFSSGKPNLSVRKQLAQRSLAELSTQLAELDPDSQSIIATKNRRRLERAIEATLTAGIPFSQQKKSRPSRFDVLQIGMRVPKPELEKRINRRVDQMMQQGLLDEVRDLQQHYGDLVLSRLGIGYRELGDALLDKISIEEAINLIKLHTRQYAKRQMTWFKRDHRIQWQDRPDQPQALISSFLRSSPFVRDDLE